MTGKATVINAADLGKVGTLRPGVDHDPLEIVYVNVGELTLFPGNARKGVPEKIAHSIRAYGFFDPITVQRSTGNIITGNHSYKAAMDCGITEVPVVYRDVDDDMAVGMNLAHNKLSDDATYDPTALIGQLVSVEDLLPTGWTDEEVRALIGEDDEPEEDDDEPLGIDGLGVVILAQNEAHQQQIIDDLIGQGYSAAPTTVKNTVKLGNEF